LARTVTKDRVTAQDFYDYKKCPHRVYLNHCGNPLDKLPQSEFLNLLFEQAILHEVDVLNDLPHQLPGGETVEERAQSTLELMRAASRRIYHGVLLLPDMSGIPDLIEKVQGHSNFGNYFYKPVDVKSGSGYEDQETGKLRKDYGLQLYHYGVLLEGIQGVFPNDGEILNRRKQRVTYPLSQFKEMYLEALREVRALVSGAATDSPAMCADCGKCQWWGLCEKELVASSDVTLLPDVGRAKKISLNASGVKTIQDIATFDFSQVRLKGIGPKTVTSMRQAAISVLSNKLQVLGRAILPDADVKFYLDFEDDPTQDLIYLCGFSVEPPIDNLNYHGLFCADEEGEARIWTQFQKTCAAVASKDYRVFHYSAYERTKLSALEKKYGAREKSALEIFRSRMVDLLPIVKQTVVLPTRNYSLKSIVPFLGLKYSAKDAGGAQSIVWFQEYQRDPTRTDVLKKLLQYNREDCEATRAVEQWLKGL
jgi:predicted RecB family nuclease